MSNLKTIRAVRKVANLYPGDQDIVDVDCDYWSIQLEAGNVEVVEVEYEAPAPVFDFESDFDPED